METEQTEFIRILLQDVQRALDQTARFNTSADRRNLLRTIISAAEGASWVYRMHILSMAEEFDVATPQIAMAFAEASFVVTDKGKLVEQPRYISLTAMIRLATEVAQSFCPDLNVNFNDPGWQKLREAITARNRITHPKNNNDLLLSDLEVQAAKDGFFWFLDMSAHVMEQTIREFKITALISRKIVGELRAGNPETLELYYRVHRESDE